MNGVSIVICCHNSVNRLPPTLDHLKKQVVPQDISWEVIVVDNASTDQTAQTALGLWDDFQGAPLRVVAEPIPGLSNARIKGFQEARYEFVSFVDDDNWVAEDWIKTVFRIMSEHPEVGACGGKSDAVYEVEPPEWYKGFLSKIAVGIQSDQEGDVTDTRGWLWGAGISIRKSAWDQIIDKRRHFLLSGRKGNKFTSGEDNEICFLLRMLGWRLYYTPRLRLEHFIPSSRLSWDYLCHLSSDNGETIVILSRYSRYMSRKEFSENNNYIVIWFDDLYSLLKKWVKAWRRSDHNNIPGSRKYLDYLLLTNRIVALMKLGPSGLHEIDRQVDC